MLVVSPSDSYPLDLTYASGCLVASGHDLQSACLISLGTDAERVGPREADEPRAGWWADAYASEIEGADFAAFGSQLWTLDTVHVREAAVLAPQYAREALQWLVDDGHVTAVDATAAVVGETLYVFPLVTLRNAETVTLGPFAVGAS